MLDIYISLIIVINKEEIYGFIKFLWYKKLKEIYQI